MKKLVDILLIVFELQLLFGNMIAYSNEMYGVFIFSLQLILGIAILLIKRNIDAILK